MLTSLRIPEQLLLLQVDVSQALIVVQPIQLRLMVLQQRLPQGLLLCRSLLAMNLQVLVLYLAIQPLCMALQGQQTDGLIRLIGAVDNAIDNEQIFDVLATLEDVKGSSIDFIVWYNRI